MGTTSPLWGSLPGCGGHSGRLGCRRERQGWRFVVSLLVLLLAPALLAAELTISGHVVDENEAPVGGARITVRRTAPSGIWQTQTDADGAFHILVSGPGDYSVTVEREGYYELRDRPLRLEVSGELTLAIDTVREVFQSADVSEKPSPVDVTRAQNEERLTGTEVNDIPFSNSHSLLSSMSLLPGAVLDPTGTPHFNGSSQGQMLYLLNGFNITDPIYGAYNAVLALEGVRAMEFSSGRYSPEYGKGSAGFLNISTENGTDTFHYTATDFIPGLDIQHGTRFGNWYPRVGFSGPVIRGRAWFSDTFDSEYTNSLVPGLPRGENTRSGWLGSNLLHGQVNLTPGNILFADFMVNVNNENRVGLGVLDPVSTTTTVHTRRYFASVKDQIYLGRGALLEIGYGHYDSSTKQIPQGISPYIFSADGRSGNYFVSAIQTGSRDEGMAHAYLPHFHWLGAHQIEAGGGADHIGYDADFHRTDYEVEGLEGQVLSKTTFFGSGMFRVPDTEADWWVLDTWRPTKRLQVEAGVRGDWDRKIGAYGGSPHAAASWSPFASGRTRIIGGYSMTHDPVLLDLLGRPLDQMAITTEYEGTGQPFLGPVRTVFVAPDEPLKLPRAINWSGGVDQQVKEHLFFGAKYLWRHTTDGFVFINQLDPGGPPSVLPLANASLPGEYGLTNSRRDNFDSAQFSVRQTFSGQFEWMLSYIHSRAVSNAVLDYNSTEALQVLPNLVPVPWDTPNRILGWGYLPLPWKNWAVAVLADARDGFPFSAADEYGTVVGGVDSRRYPFNFDLNVAVERMITLRGYRFALRGGVDNLTNQANPTAVNNTIGSPQFLQYYGEEGRHFVVRVRFFGRAEKTKH